MRPLCSNRRVWMWRTTALWSCKARSSRSFSWSLSLAARRPLDCWNSWRRL
jgi:hypothetical protein